ncbi:MAG: LLM class flavin-dependent oxidoreductase [Pseudomonadota bacterium]
MRLGALLGIITDPTNPDALAEQARTLAGEGFDSLWTPQAIGRGFMMPDALTMLTTAAAVTKDVEIGTAVLQLPLYHPVELAHRVFSLMQLSGNRLTLGLGVGSTENDFIAFDRDYGARFKDFESRLQTLREVFATGKHGETDLSPWPAVQGGPLLFFGTWGKNVVRAAQEFDGWIASGMHRTPDQVVAKIPEYREAGGKRAMVSTIQVSAQTDLGELKTTLDKYSEAGFDDAVVMILPGGPTPAEVRKLVQ